MNFRNFDGNHGKDWIAKAREYMTGLAASHMPGVSVNIVVFHYHEGSLQVLLMRFADTPFYMLPGGYVRNEEDLDHAAARCFREWTGKQEPLPEQFYTSGKANRFDPQLSQKFRSEQLPDVFENWFGQRKISVCYYVIADDSTVSPQVMDYFISAYQWTDITRLPDMMFDHRLIIEKAVHELQKDLDNKILEYRMVPEEFTMGELQRLYEAVYGHPFTRTNFQRRMLSLGILERLGKKYSGGAHKAPYLYRVKS